MSEDDGEVPRTGENRDGHTLPVSAPVPTARDAGAMPPNAPAPFSPMPLPQAGPPRFPMTKKPLSLLVRPDIPVHLLSVSKIYRGILGINNITLSFLPGITALLGPNGAGKSTTLKIIAGLVRPSSGFVFIYGKSPREDVSVYSRVGYCPEHDAFYPDMTGREFVAHFLRIRGVEAGKALKMASLILEKLEMGKKMDKPIRTYSRGMKQKVKVANAIVHNPDVLVMDEPLQGTDPEARHLLIENMKEWGRTGKTIIVSSHILNEVEKLTNRVVLINEGRVFAEGEMEKIREMMTNRPLTIRITPRNPQDIRRLASFLLQEPSVASININGTHIIVHTMDARRFYSVSPRLLRDSGIPINEYLPVDDNLESLYYYLMTQSRW